MEAVIKVFAYTQNKDTLESVINKQKKAKKLLKEELNNLKLILDDKEELKNSLGEPSEKLHAELDYEIAKYDYNKKSSELMKLKSELLSVSAELDLIKAREKFNNEISKTLVK